MKTPSLLILLLILFSMPLFSQIDLNNPPWDLDCEEKGSQMDLNICSYQSFLIADSVLNLLYNEIIQSISKDYKNELEQYTDTTDVLQKNFLLQLKAQKEAVIQSKKDFTQFRESCSDIISLQYYGGSMQPMATNYSLTDITAKQIEILISIKNELE